MLKTKQHQHLLLTHLGDAIRNRRVDSGFSQQELASKTDMHRTYITDIEAGNRNISMLTYSRLTEALKCAASLPLFEAERSMAQESASPLYGSKGGLSRASLLLHLQNGFCRNLDIVALELQVKASMSRLQVCVENYSRKLNCYPNDGDQLVEALSGQLAINPFTKTPECPSLGTAIDEELATRVSSIMRPGEIEYSSINKGANYIIRGGGADGKGLSGHSLGSIYVLSGNLRSNNQP
jgi:transcriptional regulator with XRE-family HTH domain